MILFLVLGHRDQNAARGPSPAAYRPSRPPPPLDCKPRAVISESAYTTRCAPGQGKHYVSWQSHRFILFT